MQFVVIAFDGTDPQAPARRQAARPAHLKRGDELVASGNLWYGSALLHDDGSMKGSIYIMDFENRAELDAWYESEPYVIGDVWRDVEVHEGKVNNPEQFNKS